MLEKSKEHFEKGEFNEALALVTQCTNGDMQNKKAWKLKVKILLALNQPNEADDCCEIMEDIQNKQQLKIREKLESRESTPELPLEELLAHRITLDLNSLKAARQLTAFSARPSEEKRLKRK